MNSAVEPQARSASKGAKSAGLDPALVRLAVNGICQLASSAGRPIRRSVAREFVCSGQWRHADENEILRGARNWLGIKDETGETAARNVDRAKRGGQP